MRSIFRIQFPQDVLDMNSNCTIADEERIGDLLILLSLRHATKNLSLLLCQFVLVVRNDD